MANFKEKLDQFADYRDVSRPSINSATIDVTEKYARRKLKVKKGEPIVYRGLRLTCRGSRAYRLAHS
jgi:hypothetical protein